MSLALAPLLQPYWYTREVYNETVFFLNNNGSAKLLYTPSEVLAVKNYSLHQTYTEGVDYVVEGNTIRRLTTGSMPFYNVGDYYASEAAKKADTDTSFLYSDAAKDLPEIRANNLTGNRSLKVRENYLAENYQVAVSYRHNEVLVTPDFISALKGIPAIQEKLKNKENIKILNYGASITEGWGASGMSWDYEISPHLPSWPKMLERYIDEKYGVNITFYNEAIGGRTSQEGRDLYDTAIEGLTPHKHGGEGNVLRTHEHLYADLLILGFGTNDYYMSEAQNLDNHRYIINQFLKENPSSSVLLLPPELVNTYSKLHQQLDALHYFQPNYKTLLSEYKNSYYAPVYDMSQYFLSRGKTSRDLIGNNLNHPSDFIVRSYAQIILKSILGTDFSDESVLAAE
jgi:lysophospholipase L1-like esterase